MNRGMPMPLFEFENFDLSCDDSISRSFRAQGIQTFYEAIDYVHQCEYRRADDRSNYRAVVQTGYGTCSTKHALLAELATTYNVPLQLLCGIVLLDEATMPSLKELLTQLEVDVFPEAHCFLQGPSIRLDLTFKDQPIYPTYVVIESIPLSPDQIGSYKINWHRAYLQLWMQNVGLNQRYTLENIWLKREHWIQYLSALNAEPKLIDP
ncbi:MAG: hypothetical protein CMF51_00735 [Legionellales bacterium]|nr:hypothetical protein [Legionellales bacterium]